MFTVADWLRTSISSPWIATTVFHFIFVLTHLVIFPWEPRTKFFCISFTNRPIWANNLALLSLICAVLKCSAVRLLFLFNGVNSALTYNFSDRDSSEGSLSSWTRSVQDNYIPALSIFLILLEFSGFRIVWFDSGSLDSTHLQKSYFWTGCGIGT